MDIHRCPPDPAWSRAIGQNGSGWTNAAGRQQAAGLSRARCVNGLIATTPEAWPVCRMQLAATSADAPAFMSRRNWQTFSKPRSHSPAIWPVGRRTISAWLCQPNSPGLNAGFSLHRSKVPNAR